MKIQVWHIALATVVGLTIFPKVVPQASSQASALPQQNTSATLTNINNIVQKWNGKNVFDLGCPVKFKRNGGSACCANMVTSVLKQSGVDINGSDWVMPLVEELRDAGWQQVPIDKAPKGSVVFNNKYCDTSNRNPGQHMGIATEFGARSTADSWQQSFQIHQGYAIGSRLELMRKGGNCGGALVPPSTTAKGSGNFINPSPGYRISSGFGKRKAPCAGCSSFHAAIDLATPMNTPIKSSDGGSVIFAGNAKGWGKTVVIDHGNGYQSRYSHLDSIKVKVGDSVNQGQVIALSGQTGLGTGPHLDFAIYKGNWKSKANAVDPRKLISF